MDSDLRSTRLQFANFQDTNFAVPGPRNGRTYKATDFTGAHIEGAIFINATGFTSGLPYVDHGYPLEFYQTKGRPVDLYTPCIKPMCGGLCQTVRRTHIPYKRILDFGCRGPQHMKRDAIDPSPARHIRLSLPSACSCPSCPGQRIFVSLAVAWSK